MLTTLIDLGANTTFVLFQCDTLHHYHWVTNGKFLMVLLKNLLSSLVVLVYDNFPNYLFYYLLLYFLNAENRGENPSAEFSSAILWADEVKSYSACTSNDIAFSTRLLEIRVVTEQWAQHQELSDGESPSLCCTACNVSCCHTVCCLWSALERELPCGEHPDIIIQPPDLDLENS